MAEKLAANETPFYIKYDVEIGLAAIVLVGVVLWYIAVRKKY